MKQAVRLHVPRISTESERCKCLRLAVAEVTVAFMPIPKPKVLCFILPRSLKFLCSALPADGNSQVLKPLFGVPPKPQPLRSLPQHHWA